MSRVQDTELKLCVEIYTHPRISQRDFPVMRFVQHKSTETKMINNSLASTRRADRQHHKASHARRKEKKWRARERSHGFIMLGMESATAGCGIPNDSLAGISHAIKIQSYRFSVRYRRRSRDAVADEEKALHLALLHTCVKIYTASAHFTKRFPGHVFCSTQVAITIILRTMGI